MSIIRVMTTALVANHSVRSTSLYALSDLVWADPNLAITFSVLTARLRPHLTWRSNMKILNLNTSDTPCPYTCAVCGHLLEVSERPMRSLIRSHPANPRPVLLAPGSVFVWAGVACWGLGWCGLICLYGHQGSPRTLLWPIIGQH